MNNIERAIAEAAYGEPTTWTYIAAVLAGGSLIAFFGLMIWVSIKDTDDPLPPEPMPTQSSYWITAGFFGLVAAIFAVDYWLALRS